MVGVIAVASFICSVKQLKPSLFTGGQEEYVLSYEPVSQQEGRSCFLSSSSIMLTMLAVDCKLIIAMKEG